jgi:hypothetical protein
MEICDLRSPLEILPYELWRFIGSYLDYIALKKFSCAHSCFLEAAEDNIPTKIKRSRISPSRLVRPQRLISLQDTIVAFDFLPRGTVGVLLGHVNQHRRRELSLVAINTHGEILQTIFQFSENSSLLTHGDLKYNRAQRTFAVTSRSNEIDFIDSFGRRSQKLLLNQHDVVQAISFDPQQNLLVLLEDRIAHFRAGNYQDRKDLLLPSCPLTFEGIATKLYDRWIFCTDFSSKTIFALRSCNSLTSILITSYRFEDASALRGIDVDEDGNLFICVLEKETAKGHIAVSFLFFLFL